MLYNINRGKRTPAKTGKQLIPLSFDKNEVITITPEESKEIIKKLSKYIKN